MFVGPQLPYQKSPENDAAVRHPFGPSHGKIVIVLRCNPWPVGWSPAVLGVLYAENRPKFGKLATLTPRRTTIVRRWPCKLPGAWTTTWSKQYFSVVHPMLWVWCLFDLLQVWGFGGKWPLNGNFSLISVQNLRFISDSRVGDKFAVNWPLRSCRKVVMEYHDMTTFRQLRNGRLKKKQTRTVLTRRVSSYGLPAWAVICCGTLREPDL